MVGRPFYRTAFNSLSCLGGAASTVPKQTQSSRLQHVLSKELPDAESKANDSGISSTFQRFVPKKPLDSVLSAKQQSFLKLCHQAQIAPRIGFIGGGNMAQAMIRGFLNSGLVLSDMMCVSDPISATLNKIEEDLNIQCDPSNDPLLAKCGQGLVVLAVKPDVLESVLAQYRDELSQCGLLVTILAGVPIDAITSQLREESKVPIARVMPNTAATIGHAASVIARGAHCNETQLNLVRILMETFGTCREVSENQMNAVTGLSGSGPAYAYTVIDAMADGGVKMGLSRDLATHLAAQTVMGAAKMILDTGKHPGDLKNMVCSPGGTTITGVHVLEERGIRGSLISAVEAAVLRADHLGSISAK